MAGDEIFEVAADHLSLFGGETAARGTAFVENPSENRKLFAEQPLELGPVEDVAVTAVGAFHFCPRLFDALFVKVGGERHHEERRGKRRDHVDQAARDLRHDVADVPLAFLALPTDSDGCSDSVALVLQEVMSADEVDASIPRKVGRHVPLVSGTERGKGGRHHKLEDLQPRGLLLGIRPAADLDAELFGWLPVDIADEQVPTLLLSAAFDCGYGAHPRR